MIKKSYLFVLLCFQTAFLSAQIDSTSLGVLLAKYPFIRASENNIENDSSLYTSFFPKLQLLSAEKNFQIAIAHIGDSHIQAGQLTDQLRLSFQNEFGNAGRGFIFPYCVAKTNGPADYSSSSNVTWYAKRNAVGNGMLPFGVGGHTLYSNDPNAYIDFKIKRLSPATESISQLLLFHNSFLDSNFVYSITDTAGRSIDSLLGYIGANRTISSYKLFGNPGLFRIRQFPENEQQNSSVLFGFSLQNGKPGVIYHSIGVNGAEYRHYNQSDYFSEQLAALEPDLVIIAMGTNEAFNFTSFNADSFYRQVDVFITTLQQLSPNSTFLISIPPESFKPIKLRRGYGFGINPVLAKVRFTLIQYAKNNGIPYWDLYKIMGGQGSMGKWYVSGMADKRRVHFSGLGYTIQGKLLYEALMKSYRNYLHKNP